MKMVIMIAAAVLVAAGCGGDDEPSRSPQETAEAWVSAINATDYEQVCDLSVISDEFDCVEAMKAKPFGDDLRVEAFSDEGQAEDAVATFGVSSQEDRKPRGDAWTAYAPGNEFTVERLGDEYKVHFEISVIK